jgi:3'(2'), 5'-bisphosphate nucleotidase
VKTLSNNPPNSQRPTPSDTLLALSNIVEAAGGILMKHYLAGKHGARQKANGTFVTNADLESDMFLRQALESFSAHQVISEERDTLIQAGDSKYWLVDPLDGTLSFMEGSDEFAICLALMDCHRPVIGFIHAPATGESYVCEKGRGAFRKLKGEWRAMSPLSKELVSNGRTAVISRHHHNPVTEEFVQSNRFDQSIKMGSALKFARVACSEATIYPNFDGSGEWDTAAGQALIEELGGAVIETVTNKPLRYGKPRFRNPSFLAFGPATPYDQWMLPKP